MDRRRSRSPKKRRTSRSPRRSTYRRRYSRSRSPDRRYRDRDYDVSRYDDTDRYKKDREYYTQERIKRGKREDWDDETLLEERRKKRLEMDPICVADQIWAPSPQSEISSDSEEETSSSETYTSDSSESDVRERKKRKKSKKRKKRRKKKESETSDSSDESDSRKKHKKSKKPEKPIKTQEEKKEEPPQQILGPQPIKIKPISYGKDLLPGEGSAMASYVQQNKRIPRRGEVGIDNTQIEKFENLGYIMSGDRNKRLTAVRMRKEQQVISAEEQRKQLLQQYEERLKRENELIAQFRNMIEKRKGDK